MKKIIILAIFCQVFLLNRVSAQDYIVTITNKVSAFPNFTFDVYVQTPSGTAYLGNSDFHFTFNNNYLTNPTSPFYQMGNMTNRLIICALSKHTESDGFFDAHRF